MYCVCGLHSLNWTHYVSLATDKSNTSLVPTAASALDT
jgi:hypothetical protein